MYIGKKREQRENKFDLGFLDTSVAKRLKSSVWAFMGVKTCKPLKYLL